MTTQAPVSYAIGRYLGLPGSITRYFWVQAIYPSGRSVVSNLVEIDNAGSLTSQNQINIQWAPAPGAIGYDVVETPTSSAPTLNATATIGVALGLTDTNLTLSAEPTLVSWTYSTGNGTIGADIDVGTTQVINGIDGSILLQQSGVVSENADLAWDDSTGLIIGKSVTITAGSLGVSGGDINVDGELSASGNIFGASNSAPADGDLSAGQFAIWFDDTDMAGKLMVKAKTADGTVVTGSVTLT